VAWAVGILAGGAAEPPARGLESRRLRAAVAYVGTAGDVRRMGALDGLTREDQGRMEAAVAVARMLRAPAGAPAPAEVALKFDSRAPAPEGEGFVNLRKGEAVLVFADSLEPAYPRELLHGPPASLGAEVRALRDFVAAMDAATMGLHGLSPATRAAQVRLYDDALAAIARLPR
jgi:hypothetical protein